MRPRSDSATIPANLRRRTLAAMIAAATLSRAVRAQAPAPPGAPSIEPALLRSAAEFAYQRERAGLREQRRIDPGTTHAAYVRWLAAPMVLVASGAPYYIGDWSWRIAVERSDDLVFWCLPGGNLVISSAFFAGGRFSAGEIAALLAHGYAHHLAGHDASEAALRLASHPDGKSPDPNRRLLLLADILTALAKRDPYRRDLEREADSIALVLLAQAGHDPRALLTLWRKLAFADRSSKPTVATLHPVGPERLAALEAQLPAAMALYEKTRAGQTRAALGTRGDSR
jgi:predicted Zn-dependent protease